MAIINGLAAERSAAAIGVGDDDGRPKMIIGVISTNAAELAYCLICALKRAWPANNS
jgi:hypothetical protein